MKKFIQIIILFLSVNLSQLIIPEKASAQSVSFQVFYDDLSPYGSWFESPEYGYVWCPHVSGFSPYSTNGYWVFTDVGWTWVSDYSWGWAPFHYGRWYYDPLYGYVWVPGYEWGPGWVTWRRSDDYYGWAPIGPGVNINIAYSSGYNVPYNYWHFVSCHNFGRRDIYNHYIDRSKNVTIINNTTVINNTRVDNTRKSTFNPGPDRMEVQKKAGRTINPVAIVDENKPIQHITKNSMQLYRPIVQNNSNASTKPVPAKLTPLKEVRDQANNIRPGKNNEAMNERNEKQPMNQQPSKQNNEKPDKELQQQEKKSIRDEQPRQLVPQRDNVKNPEPRKQQPVHQQPMRRPREEQPPQPVKQERNDQLPVQKPERQQVQSVRQQSAEPQQNRERPVRQRPVRQAPVQREIPAAPPKDRKD